MGRTGYIRYTYEAKIQYLHVLGIWRTAWVGGRRYATVSQTMSDYITRSTRPSRFFSRALKNMGRPGYEASSV